MTLELPTIMGYGDYASSNYGLNAIRVSVGPITVYYSYRTPVAFRVQGRDLVVRENMWSATTGKHLNWIDGGNKKERVDSAEFERLWDEQIGPLLGEQTFSGQPCCSFCTRPRRPATHVVDGEWETKYLCDYCKEAFLEGQEVFEEIVYRLGENPELEGPLHCGDCETEVKNDRANRDSMTDHGRCVDYQIAWQYRAREEVEDA